MSRHKLQVEIWSPLPPKPSGIADYVAEQLETLAESLDLTLIVDRVEDVEPAIRERHRVRSVEQSNGTTLRVYHLGNSPLHRRIYPEALRTPGIVVLHEWNLHELLLGFAVTANRFDEYRSVMRREHGERGTIAANTIASALGGRHWTGVFLLNADLLSRALGVVSLSRSTAAKVTTRRPDVPVLHLAHHALLKSSASNRSEARARLGLAPGDRVVVLPGLGTSAKSIDAARAALETVSSRVSNVIGLSVGSDPGEGASSRPQTFLRHLGRVDLNMLGDALLAADVVLALRFPSRGETSGVLMRALAAGRAAVVTAGSTADEDLDSGVVARVNPGPHQVSELGAVLEFLLTNVEARERMERLALDVAGERPVGSLTVELSTFIERVSVDRSALEARLEAQSDVETLVPPFVRDELRATASSLGLVHLPSNVFEKLAWIR